MKKILSETTAVSDATARVIIDDRPHGVCAAAGSPAGAPKRLRSPAATNPERMAIGKLTIYKIFTG